MAITINIVGQGEVSQATTSINHSWTGVLQSTMTWQGTAYTLTATPAQGWTFASWRVQATKRFDQSSDGGSTWSQGTPGYVYWTSTDNPTTSTITNLTEGTPWSDDAYLFDGYGEEDYTTMPSPSDYIFRQVWYDVEVTLTFERSHVPTHKIIRSDSGTIMRGGTANLILRDD